MEADSALLLIYYSLFKLTNSADVIVIIHPAVHFLSCIYFVCIVGVLLRSKLADYNSSHILMWRERVISGSRAGRETYSGFESKTDRLCLYKKHL